MTCTPQEAVERALSMVGRTEPYILGTGDYHPTLTTDLPFTTNKYGTGCDCWGLAGAYAYETKRHRPGYNKGAWSTVSDDVNCDSAIEQAEHLATDRLWEVADEPALGDLIVWPSIRGADGKRVRIGHVAIVVGIRAAEWDVNAPQYDLLDVVQCQSSTRPAIKRSTGAIWNGRDWFKGKQKREWRTRILRSTAATIVP